MLRANYWLVGRKGNEKYGLRSLYIYHTNAYIHTCIYENVPMLCTSVNRYMLVNPLKTTKSYICTYVLIHIHIHT